MLKTKQATLKYKRIDGYVQETGMPPIGAPSWCLNKVALERLNRSTEEVPIYDWDSEDGSYNGMIIMMMTTILLTILITITEQKVPKPIRERKENIIKKNQKNVNQKNQNDISFAYIIIQNVVGFFIKK